MDYTSDTNQTIRINGSDATQSIESPFRNDVLLDYNDLNYSQFFMQLPPPRDPLYVVIPITFVYILIFVTGVIGNICTCIVIAKHRTMHTATNYYLFSLAISDLCLLLSGAPQEVYYMWQKYPYVFGEAFCVMRGLMAETSANATVLTITSFTVERYLAICHPFLQHKMSKLSRAVRLILIVWVVSLVLAVPMALQFGVVDHGNDLVVCDVKREIIKHAFELSTALFFLTPMMIITVLYVLIGLKLRSSCLMKRENGVSVRRQNHVNSCRQNSMGTRRVIKMLVAVVVAFILCWAPFHAQRLVAFYDNDRPILYAIITYTSGVMYYLSTCINPLLYHLMSNKFREAFKETLANCGQSPTRTDDQKRAYRVLPRCSQRRWYAAQDSGNYSGSSFRGESLYSAITQKQSHDSMTFVSRAESVNTKNASSNSNGGGVISFPTLYYDIEQAHSDSSSFDEESASPDYKIKYSGTSRVADSHEASQALSDTINATGSKRRRQMFTSLVQYLIWRRPSQDSGRAIGMTTTQTTVIDKHFLADSPIASSRLATLTHDQGCDNIFDIRYRCNRDGMNSASTSPETGESADGMVKLAVGDDNDGEVVTITDELSEYMEEIRLRELKLKYRLGRGRQAI